MDESDDSNQDDVSEESGEDLDEDEVEYEWTSTRPLKSSWQICKLNAIKSWLHAIIGEE